MSHDHHSSPIPRPLIVGAGILVAVAISVAFLGESERDSRVTYQEAELVDTRALYFADRADGTVIVTTGPDNALVDELEPGTGAFVRTVMRTLARTRLKNGYGPEEPFHLSRYADGRIVIEDRTTGEEISLVAFGPTNVQAFASLLDQEVRPQ